VPDGDRNGRQRGRDVHGEQRSTGASGRDDDDDEGQQQASTGAQRRWFGLPPAQCQPDHKICEREQDQGAAEALVLGPPEVGAGQEPAGKRAQ
jgi:hypothetical protein